MDKLYKLPPDELERLERLRLENRAKTQLKALADVPQGTSATSADIRATYARRARFMAGAYLAGASTGQLASLFRITRSTVFNIIQREVSPSVKAKVQRVAISWERVSALWAAFCDHSEEFEDDDAEQAAARLFELAKGYED